MTHRRGQEPFDPRDPVTWWSVALVATVVPLIALIFGGPEIAGILFIGAVIADLFLLDEVR